LKDVCTATKRNGEPCTLPPTGSSGLCWAHDPKNAVRRRRGQSRGGKSKPGRELLDVKRRLSALADDVLEGNVDKGAAGVVSQVLNGYLRAIGMELKVKEVEELEVRLQELEAALEQRGERGAYGFTG
jgi:hypothetical protein